MDNIYWWYYKVYLQLFNRVCVGGDDQKKKYYIDRN